MMKCMASLVAVLAVFAVLSPDAAGQQCRGGGGSQTSGRGTPTQSFASSLQNPGFNQNPQFNQQAYLQQAAMQQLQFQRAVLQQQQYALWKAQEREESRQRRLAAANARREKEAKHRAERQSKGELSVLTNNK